MNVQVQASGQSGFRLPSNLIPVAPVPHGSGEWGECVSWCTVLDVEANPSQ